MSREKTDHLETTNILAAERGQMRVDSFIYLYVCFIIYKSAEDWDFSAGTGSLNYVRPNMTSLISMVRKNNDVMICFRMIKRSETLTKVVLRTSY